MEGAVSPLALPRIAHGGEIPRTMDGPDDDTTGSSLRTYLEKWRNQYLFDFDIFLDPTLILI